MKVHNDLEELLNSYNKTLLLDLVLTKEQLKERVNTFIRFNSLALGKPELLTKNKQFEKSCCKENTVQWTRQRVKCTECGYMRVGQL